MMDIIKTVDGLFSRIYGDYRKFLKYFSVGIVGTLVDYSAYTILIVFFDMYFMVATAIAYFIGMVINFVLNRRFTFNNTYRKVHYQFASFGAIALVGLGIQELVMYGIVHYALADTTADLPLLGCRVAATFAGFIWTYIANKKVTFKIFK
jgi:putative flippase GtrA